MKLASLKGGRDGRLVVVSRDLTRAVAVPEIAPTLQAALDDWDRLRAAARSASIDALNDGQSRRRLCLRSQSACASPLPRAYQWADGSAYVTHVELVRKARGAEMPPKLLDRSPDVSGRLRRFSRDRAIRSSPPTKPGASISKAKSR